MQQAGTGAPGACAPLGAQRALMRGAARQPLAAVAVARVEQVHLRLQGPGAQPLRSRERRTLQLRAARVARAAKAVRAASRAARRVALVADQIAHAVAVERGTGAQRTGGAGVGAPVQAHLQALPTLGFEVADTVARVVKVIEAGRTESGAGQRAQAPARHQLQAATQPARGDGAEIAAVVAPQVGLPGQRARAASPLQHQSLVAALDARDIARGLCCLALALQRGHPLAQLGAAPHQLRLGLLAQGAKAVQLAATAGRVVLAARDARAAAEALRERASPVQRAHGGGHARAKVG